MTQRLSLAELDQELLSPRFKGLPERSFGLRTAEFLATEPTLDEFWTPLLVLDDKAMRSNTRVMATWMAERGLEHMPHGKTTMAPALWQRQLDAGCTGITLANMAQVRAARTFGLTDILLANDVTDARALHWLATELQDPDFQFVCWADSVETVQLMHHALAGRAARPVNVMVELGGPGGRTGARTNEAALEIAREIERSDSLRLAGVGGYEGSLGYDRLPETVARVRGYLDRQVALHEILKARYDDHGDVFVSAGGSAYFDLVADAYAEAQRNDQRTRWTLRSGAYLTHDRGFYRSISPLDETNHQEGDHLKSAIQGICRVASRPDPALALLDGGKRDLPYDAGMPVPLGVGASIDTIDAAPPASHIDVMNDQHTYLTLDDAASNLQVGDVVSLGLSHPCTAFDKWQLIPVIASAKDPRVVELVRTFF